jgi:hypothetical protein
MTPAILTLCAILAFDVALVAALWRIRRPLNDAEARDGEGGCEGDGDITVHIGGVDK